VTVSLEVKGLYFRHPNMANWVLEDLNLKVEAGEITTILGPNGAGKTTLFRCILGLWSPQKGSIVCGTFDLSRMTPSGRARLCAFVPQDHVPPFAYPIKEVVLMGRTPYVPIFSTPSRVDRRCAEEAMEKMGIGHLGNRAYTNLSGGERQLVLLARALAQETPVLLLDEPTAHLDYRNQVEILRRVRQIVRDRRLTVLMTMHDPNLTLQFSDSVALMKAGRMVVKGPPREVMTSENLSFLYELPLKIWEINGEIFIRSPKP